jgi:hypothetical protein
MAKKREYSVTRYWPVEMRSVAYVKASSVEEACRLALEDEDYSDAEICDGSDGETTIGTVEWDDGECDAPDSYFYSEEQKRQKDMIEALRKIAHKARTGEGDFNVAELAELVIGIVDPSEENKEARA